MGASLDYIRLSFYFMSPRMNSPTLTLTVAFAMIVATMAAPAKTAPHKHEAAEVAKKTITDMLAAGSDSSACADLADSLMSTVQKSTNDRVAVVAGLDDGSTCPTTGQDLVDGARSAVTTAESAAASAHEAASSAASAPVHFGSFHLDSLGELAEGHCTSFESHPAYLAAKSEAGSASDAATEADAAVDAAKNAVAEAEEEQKRLVEECQCAAHREASTAYATASVITEEEKADWEKGKHMKCVLAGTAPADCDVGSPDVPAAPALAEGVTDEACHRKGSHWALECTSTMQSVTDSTSHLEPTAPEGYTMTGGGIRNNVRDFSNPGSAFSAAFPRDNADGRNQFVCLMYQRSSFDCWVRSCKQGGRPLQCQTKSQINAHIITPDEGYVMTGGGSMNRHNGYDGYMLFEQSRPHENGWATDMAAGHAPEGYENYVVGCKHLDCITQVSPRGNHNVVTCPAGYEMTSCGARNYQGWRREGGFEEFRPDGNGCLCDMGFGHGDSTCYARCCKSGA